MNPLQRPVRFDLALRIAWLLIFVLAVEWPGGPLVTLGPPQTVQTNNPKAGVHTRLTAEGAAWKIQRNLQLVREMGATWIVEFFSWADIETGKNTFDWGHTDQVIDQARTQGLKVIARLGLVPAWARPDPRRQATTFNYLDRDHYDDFGDFVSAFVDRYKDRVDHIIIWNEPNLSFEWGLRPVDAQAYVDLLKVAYRRAKEANPNVVVLAGALAPTLEPEGSPAGLNDLIYLQRMYAAGAKDYFDALAVHAYGLLAPLDEAPDPGRINFRRVELEREVMQQNGDGAKQIYITEAGWNDSPRWNQAVAPTQRIEYTLQALDWVKDKDWIEVLTFWVFSYPQATHTFADNWTFMTDDLRPKPIYDAVRKHLTMPQQP